MKKISIEELKQMRGSEGLVLQGCGGDLQEWVDGIHEMLAKEGIFKNGGMFHEVYSFENEGLTCLLFDIEDVDLDIGKLAAWRLSTRENFGSMWLSDYLDNHIGMDSEPEPEQKPDCELIGQDGNIFNLMGIASKTLKKNGMKEQAEEMVKRITQGAHNYSEALCIIGEYVNITGPDEEPEDGMGMEM
ncbi:MAG: hypothetical protein HFE61_10905 [Anaerotignum sp.]|jgi:hypothetical protein|nr:hypothetical protein [Anaerotignum sp.]